MSKRKVALLLSDIIDSAQKILSYTEDLSYNDFISDTKTIDAVIRNFEIIGEVTNRLPDELKDKSPVVDRYKIRGFRNRIVHDYAGIDYSIVWTIRTDTLPKLITAVRELLNEQ